jgi:hypothetical protein
MSDTNRVFDIMKNRGILPGTVVRSQAGHDEGGVYLVLSGAERMVRVADGRVRTADHPKTKRVKHLKALGIAYPPDELVRQMAGMASEEERNIFIRNSIHRFFHENLQEQVR